MKSVTPRRIALSAVPSALTAGSARGMHGGCVTRNAECRVSSASRSWFDYGKT